MKLHHDQYVIDGNSVLSYCEAGKGGPKLLLLHAQGTDSSSFKHIAAKLSKYYHIYLLDYYGHGKSSHIPSKYDLVSIGSDIIEFIEHIVRDDLTVLGHSSGGLIAAYIAAHCGRCTRLILEDPPFFSSQGQRRFNTYNYKDLSSACHSFLAQNAVSDFVYYYFMNQYCWNFFPADSRETIRQKLGGFALKYRTRHPERDLKVPFWPRRFLEGFKGLQHYDPRFGEAFYTDSFHARVDYDSMLSRIKCDTVFMKANTTIGENGLLQGALSHEDLRRVDSLIDKMKTVYFNCGHGIHAEKPKQFINALVK